MKRYCLAILKQNVITVQRRATTGCPAEMNDEHIRRLLWCDRRQHAL